MDSRSGLGCHAIFVAADDWDTIVAKDEAPNLLNDFQEQGGGKNVSPLPDILFKSQQQISGGFGALGLIDRAPHINAAKEWQQAWIKVLRNRRRTDVEAAIPHLVPRQGKEYFIGQAEKYTEERQNLLKTAKEAIGGGAPDSAIRIPPIS